MPISLIRKYPAQDLKYMQAKADENNKIISASSEDSDQPTLCAARVAKDLKLFHAADSETLIRLCRCPGWSESSLGAQVILLDLSCYSSIILNGNRLLEIIAADKPEKNLTYLIRLMTKPTKWLCAQRRLRSVGIQSVWSESSLCA